MRRKGQTAAELMAELQKDPAWLADRARRDAELAAKAKAMSEETALLRAELRRVGIDVKGLWELVNNNPHPFLERGFIGPYERGYPVLVKHLDRSYQKATRETIIRALTVRDGGPEVQAALLKHFYAETDPTLKWVLSNALRVAMPLKARKAHPEIAKVYGRKGAL